LAIFQRPVKLIREIQCDPFSGVGKAEALKAELSGCWSRRIDQEHGIVYQVLEKNSAFWLAATTT